MLKLKDMYALPATPVLLTECLIGPKWFPDIAEMEYHVPYSAWQAMTEDGLLTVRQVAYHDCDGERTVGLYTLWFKGEPVGIFQSSGRGGDEYVDRWITDAAAYAVVAQYVRTKLASDELKDFHDPERMVYPEEIFHFYGTDFGTQFGYPAEKRAEGFMVYWEDLIPGLDHKMTLVTAEPKHSPMPEYLRRGGHVMQRVREVNAEEHARNTRLALISKEDGYTQFYWYTPCDRPESAAVLAI
jgi:hypothetical protein